MNSAQLLESYIAAGAITQRMLDAARGEDWDALLELSQERDALFAQLMQAHPAAPTEPQQAAEIAARIRAILAADQQIQGLTRTWMDEINGVLSSVNVERKLLKAYESV